MSTASPSRPMVGIFWMLVTGLCFVGVNALVKTVGSRLPATEAAFIRYCLGAIWLLPLLGAMRKDRITPKLFFQFGARGLCHAIGVGLWFFAMTRIPIAEVTAINYLSPVYVTLGAAVVLGEKLAKRRIAAVVVALIGGMIILRPGLREVDIGHWAMMLAAFVFGGSYLLAKVLVDKTNPALVNGMLAVWVSIALAPMAMSVWITPTWTELALLAGVGLLATTGHFTMTLAFAAAPVAVTQPVTYLQLVWATMLGVLVFGEPMDVWVVVGGAVVLASVTFISLREAQLKRRAITPVSGATKI